MDGFTFIDLIVAIVIVLSALLAYARGFLREVMAIAGWIGAAILAFIFADSAQPLVRQIPTVGDILGESCELLIIASFAAVFALALIIVSLFAPLLSAAIQRTFLATFDQILGFFFGVLRGFVLVAVAFFLYNTLMPGQNIAMINDSRSAAVFGNYMDDIQNQNPEQALGWIQTQYGQLVNACTGELA